MECKKCKKTIPSDSKFCVHCGKKVTSEDETVKTANSKSKDLPEIMLEVSNHLEFIGYEIGDNQIEENGVVRFIAKHKNRSNLFVSYLLSASALIFVANYTIKNVESESKKHKFLEAINHLNNLTVLSVFSVGTAFDTITCSSWYPAVYSKKEFSNFLEFFENEIMRMLRSDVLQEFV